MLSFASAAYTADKTLLSTFSANLLTLPGAIADPKTMEWWKSEPDAWAECRRDLQQPQTAVETFDKVGGAWLGITALQLGHENCR